MANPFLIDNRAQLQGLGAIGQAIGQGLAIKGQRAQQEKARMAQAARQQELADIVNSGDASLVADFMINNPEMAQAARNAYGFRNEQTQQNMVDSAFRVLQGDDPYEVIRDRAAFVSQMGGSPAETLSALELTPEEIREGARLEIAALAPERLKAFDESRGVLSPEKKEEFDIKRATLDIRKEENETRKLEQRLAREENELRKDKLRAEIESKKQKTEQSRKVVVEGLESGITNIDRSIDTVSRALAHPGLESAVGAGSAFPTIPGSDSADFEAILETLQSQQFLTSVEQMRGLGALSENEGKKLSSAAGSLSLSMSDKQMKEELSRIEETLRNAKRKLEGRIPKSQIPEEATVSNVVEWGDL